MIESSVITYFQYFIFSGQQAKNLNWEQTIAVINIVERKNGPVPYILDGPPGTGKTAVLVASIEEIIRDDRKENYVLVCSNSNAACDELFGRLLDILDYYEILRLYTTSHDPNNVEATFLKCSNWDRRDKRFVMPELKFLYEFRVLVCTLAVESPAFKPNHFSHVFIDESCSTFETLTMIPIAGETCLIEAFHAY